jgi:D-alanine transfer protein
VPRQARRIASPASWSKRNGVEATVRIAGMFVALEGSLALSRRGAFGGAVAPEVQRGMNATRTPRVVVGEGGSGEAVARRPVGVLAAALAIMIAVAVSWGWQVQAFRMASRYRRSVAAMHAPIKFMSLTFQRVALADDHTLPVYGSSELYCCGDPYRPTQLFASQPTGFEVFALGRFAIGNLLFAQMFGALGHAIEGKKLVMIDSPPWFSNATDVAVRSYGINYSPEIAKSFIFASPISLPLREAIARRMLAYPDTLADDPLLRVGLQALADPTPLHLAAYRVLQPLGRFEAWIEQVRDARQTLHFIRRLNPKPAESPIRRRRLDWPSLAARGTKIADRRDSTNPFGFPDDTYQHLVKKGDIGGALALYRAGSTNRDGQTYPPPTTWVDTLSHSTEWSDLLLAVAVLRELGAQPFIWTMPMPGVYDNYTPISAAARQMYYDRWERELEQTGVSWLDFRASDEDIFFMTDTGAHFSPRGWIFADHALDMFWHGRSMDAIRASLATLAEQVPPPATATTWERRGRPRETVQR